MNEARLRRIPKKYSKRYKYALEAMGLGYKACNTLNEAMIAETEGQRKKLYIKAKKYESDGKKKVGVARDAFKNNDF